jgi:lambda repressor-like predicted transcriptional regulator
VPKPKTLLALIENKGHTAATFAVAVGINPAYLSRLIHKKRWPGLEVALRVADALGVGPASIWPIGGRQRVPKRCK